MNVSDSRIIEQLRGDGESALSRLFMSYRDKLRQFVQAKIAPELTPRLDGSDIVQEAFILAKRRLPSYVKDPTSTFYDWLRSICIETLSLNCNKHLNVQSRSIYREVESFSTAKKSDPLLQLTAPPKSDGPIPGVQIDEVRAKVFEMIKTMKTSDREILILKHVHDKSLKEAAVELQVSYEAVRKRYRRALKRLGRLAKSFKKEME